MTTPEIRSPNARPSGINRFSPRLMTALLLGLLLASHLGSVQGQEVPTVLLRDTFRFEPSLIQVDPGENVSLHLVNDGVAAHTFTVFVVPNVVPPLMVFAELQAFYEENEKIADVRLLGGEEVDITFFAPSLEANYAIVCMEVGHAANGMHGILQVGEGSVPGPGFQFPLGPVQTLMIIALVGVVVFAIVYHVRTSREGS